MKHKFQISMMLLTSAALITMVSCKKEVKNAQLNESNPTVQQTGNAKLNNASSSLSSAPIGYLAESNINGACTGGPINAKNSSLTSFTASSGAYISNLAGCYQVACAYNTFNLQMYVALSYPNLTYDQLYTIDLVTNQLTFVSDLYYNNVGFRVNEMEFDGNGNLIILRKGSDRPLYKFNLSSNALTLIGVMFPIHIGLYKEAITYNALTNKFYLIYETGISSPTRMSEINLTNATLSSPISYSIPNPFTNNISAYFSDASLRIIRDDNAGSGLIYNTSGTLLNQVGARSLHDATSKGLSIP